MTHLSFIKRLTPMLLVGLVCSLTACNEKEGDYMPPIVIGGDNEVVVTVQNEDGTSSEMSANQTIGCFVVGPDGKVTYMEVTTDENGNALLPVGSGAQAIAYSPIQSGWAEAFATPHPFTVMSNQTSEENFSASDLMLGTVTTKTATTRAAGTLPFSHVMTKVMVNIVDETGMLDFNNVKTYLLKMNNTVEVNLSEVSVQTMTETRTDIRMLPYSVDDRRMTSLAIVAPQHVEKDVPFFEVRIFDAVLQYPFPESADLLGNRTYNYNIRYTQTGLIPDGCYVTNWEDKGSADVDIIIRR